VARASSAVCEPEVAGAGLGLDLSTSGVSSIRGALHILPLERQITLIHAADRSLGTRRLGRPKSTRIPLVKLLVAGLPGSAEVVENRLLSGRGRQANEIRFTLLCFLDQLDDWQFANGVGGFVARVIERFLLEVRSNAAHAAWMAGDLLGDHWAQETAVPILMRLATTARFAAGRSGAIHGLSQALSGAPAGRAADIAAVLRKVARSDRSARVRASARIALHRRSAAALVATRGRPS